jgi:ribose/xylose/arabinose/galactoside ABC-type transport system permease subunit
LNINSIWQLGLVGIFLIGSVLLDRLIRTAQTK